MNSSRRVWWRDIVKHVSWWQGNDDDDDDIVRSTTVTTPRGSGRRRRRESTKIVKSLKTSSIEPVVVVVVVMSSSSSSSPPSTGGGCHLAPAPEAAAATAAVAAVAAASSRKSGDRSTSSVSSSPYLARSAALPDACSWAPRSRSTVGCAVPEDATTTNSPPGSISNAVIGLVGVNSEISWPEQKKKTMIEKKKKTLGQRVCDNKLFSGQTSDVFAMLRRYVICHK